MPSSPNPYTPPASREELLKRYAEGERDFPDIDLSEMNLSGVTLDGASFAPFSWFFDSTFDGASLIGTCFRECNVKCASFSDANLTRASFELAAIESIDLEGAITEGAIFLGASAYGYTIESPNELQPSWNRDAHPAPTPSRINESLAPDHGDA